jgi:hypothetical protein
MPLWGANTASAADKPKWLGTVGDFYNVADCVGAANTSQLADYPGAAHKGWIHQVTATTSRFNINSGGSGYANGEMVIASNVGATNATALLITDGAGAILSTYSFSKGTANAANFDDAAYTITKKISAVVVSGSPVGYQNNAPILITGGGGSGADIRLTANASGAITNVTYTNRGTGFTSTPSAAIGQVLNAVAVTNAGSGYSNTDRVIFSSGGAAFQAANGTIVTNGSGGIVSVTLTSNVGNNYTTAPSVAIQNSTGGASGGTGGVLAANLPGSGATLNVTLGGSSANVALVADDTASRVRRETLVAF